MLKLNLNETMRDYQVAADEDWQGCGETAARLLEQVPVLVDELRTARAEVVGLQEHGKDLVNILQEMQAELREARAKLRHAQAERDTLSALIPLYCAVDDYLHEPGTNDYPAGHCNPDQLEALREVFLGMSADAMADEEANDAQSGDD